MIDTLALLWHISPMLKKGFFRSMPYGDRVILVLAALLFAAGQMIGALLKRFGYDWLAWL